MEHATRDARHAQSIMQRGLSETELPEPDPETELPEADPETQADPETAACAVSFLFIFFLLIFNNNFWIYFLDC